MPEFVGAGESPLLATVSESSGEQGDRGPREAVPERRERGCGELPKALGTLQGQLLALKGPT